MTNTALGLRDLARLPASSQRDLAILMSLEAYRCLNRRQLEKEAISNKVSGGERLHQEGA